MSNTEKLLLLGCIVGVIALIVWQSFDVKPVPMDTANLDTAPGDSAASATDNQAPGPAWLKYNRRWAFPPPLAMFPMPSITRDVQGDTGC